MNRENAYEEILVTQCQEFLQIISITDKIIALNAQVKKLTLSDTPDVNQIYEHINKKECLIQKLDTLSLHIAESTAFLTPYMTDLTFLSHPLYLQLKALKNTSQEKLNDLIAVEDNDNPIITQKLNQYKEKLELDIKLREIPLSKRQIIFLFPKK